MKRLFCLLLVVISFSSVYSQAKKNLTSKKSDIVKSSKKVEKVQTPIVYNEDFEKGEELFALNKPAEAIPYFEKCLDVKDVNPLVWIHLGIAYYQIGDFTRSLACCAKGLTKDNTDHKILAYNAGNSAYALANYARAEACYAIAIKEDESFAPAYLNRANSQLKQDRLQDSKVNYIKYLELDPGTPQKEEIEKLLALLDAEILRRSKERPERIDLDFANVKNDEMISQISEEKVTIELPQEKKEEKIEEELVRFEIAQAPKLQEDEGERFKEEKEESLEEFVEEEKLGQKFEDLQIAKIEDESFADDSVEIFGEEELADALYSLPAGSVSVTPSSYGFSPYSANSKTKNQYFDVSVSEKEKVTSYVFEIVDEYGNTVRTMKGRRLSERLEWDGKTDSGTVASGRFTSKLVVNYRQGGAVEAESSGFTCFSEVPQVSIDPKQQKFSPDGDGVDDKLKFSVNVESQALIDGWKFEVKEQNRTIYHAEGKGTPTEIEWDGKDLFGDFVKEGQALDYKMTVTDTFGVEAQDSSSVKVSKSKKDPVVAKSVEVSTNADGSVEIAIPTLSFKINSFELINTPENNDTINKVYEILVNEKYEDYNITITGYVNPDGENWTREEEVLALNRAKSVEERLKNLGIPAKRLKSFYGTGRTPNKEYNRRVEFKLVK